METRMKDFKLPAYDLFKLRDALKIVLVYLDSKALIELEKEIAKKLKEMED